MKSKYEYATAYIDLLYNYASMFVVMLFMALALIADKKSDDIAGIRPKADYVITAEWSNDTNTDLDLWGEDPQGNVVYFASKDSSLMHLDHDAKGWVDATTADGKILPTSEEILTIRGVESGEYTFNIHCFGSHDVNGKPLEKEAPVHIMVKFKIIRINPEVKEIFSKDILIEYNWQEVTATRFIVNAQNDTIEFNPAFKHIVKDKK